MRTAWQRAADEFLDHVHAEGGNENTLRYYDSRLKQLRVWAEDEGIDFADFTLRDMERFQRARRGVTNRKGKPLASSTHRHDANAAKIFTSWCHENDLLDRDPLHKLKLPEADDPDIYVPPPGDIEKFLAAVTDRKSGYKKMSKQRHEADFLAARDLAITCTMVECALRPGEACGLEAKDYDRERQTIFVAARKTKYSRHIPITPILCELLDRWMEFREEVEKSYAEEAARRRASGAAPLPDLTPTLFMTLYGTSMKRDSLLEWLHRVQDQAGIKHFDLRSLRHNAISELIHKSGVLVARDVAGHGSLGTTNKYAHLRPERLREGVVNANILASVIRQRRQPRETRWKVTAR